MRPTFALLLWGCGPPQGTTFGLTRNDSPNNVLVFNNATEPEYIDPGLATGHPDGRIIDELFEGLTEPDPADLSPLPGHATSWDAHSDGRGFTFHIRTEARWTDGTPVTAHDYVWSWERVLNPLYLSRYAQQLYAVDNAARYNQGRAWRLRRDVDGWPAGTAVEGVESGVVRTTQPTPVHDAVDGAVVGELPDGALVVTVEHTGDWHQVRYRPTCPDLGDLEALAECGGPARTGWIRKAAPGWPQVGERWVPEAAQIRDDQGNIVAPVEAGSVVMLLEERDDQARVYASQVERWGWLPARALADPRGEQIRFRVIPLEEPAWDGPSEPMEPTDSIWVSARDLRVSPDVLGFRARDDHTLDVRLEGVAPYFLQQTSHMTLHAAPRQAVEKHGARWTRPENIVTNGPFRLVEHRVRDRFVLEKNEDWWGAEEVQLDKVIAYSIDNLHTSANLYRAGYTDFVTSNDLPPEFIPILQTKSDYRVSPALSVYYYRFNTTRPPLDDPRVRRALAMAIDRRDIVYVLKAGQIPANHLVPPGIPGYVPAEGPSYDPEAARALLAEAGFPGGAGFPELNILYNTLESHKLVGAIVQDQWRRELGVTVRLENREWKTYLKTVNAMDYDIARAGWIGDYLDPNTFLDLFVTDGGNNNTGWGSTAYDDHIVGAGTEPDPAARMARLAEAEALLNEEMPIMPIYWYVWVELQQPDVRGHYPNLLDRHALRHVWLDR